MRTLQHFTMTAGLGLRAVLSAGYPVIRAISTAMVYVLRTGCVSTNPSFDVHGRCL